MRNTNGFTLIEVMVVIIVMSFGLLALGAASATALHKTSSAGHEDMRWVALQRWADSLTARGYGNVTAGSDQLDRISAEWTVSTLATDLEEVELIATADESVGGWQDTLILHIYR